MDRRRNNYNPYTYGYTAPIEGSSIVYEPVYDPSETERMTELLQQRQGRYDTSRQNLSEFQGQIGGMDTYAPDMLNQKLEGFNSRVSDLVKTQYGGDYGLAANDIVGMMAAEKKDPFYKLNARQVKAADEMRQARAKDPSKFYEFAGAKPITSEDYLKQAYQDKNMGAFDEPMYGYAPNTYELAERQLKNVEANAYESLFNDLTDTEKATLAKNNVTNLAGLLKSKSNVGIDQARLDKLADSMAESMLNQDPYFMNKYGDELVQDGFDKNKKPIMKSKALVEAKKVVESASPQFVFNKSQQDIIDLRGKDVKTEEIEGLGIPLTIPGDNEVVAKSNKEMAEKTYGKDKKVSLNVEPTYVAGNESQSKPGMPTTYDVGANSFKKMEYDKNKKLFDEGIKKIKDFDELYDFPTDIAIDKDKQIAYIAELEDKYRNHNNSNLSFSSFPKRKVTVDKVNSQLADKDVAYAEVRQNGKYVPIANSEFSNFDSDAGITNVNMADFVANSVDPYTGMIVANHKDKKARIKYYPNEQAQMRGDRIKKYNDSLIKDGYAITSDFGVPTLTMKVLNNKAKYTDDGKGGFEDLIVVIPQDRVEDVQNAKTNAERKKLFDEFKSYRNAVDNQSTLVQYALDGAVDFGYVEK